MREEYLGFQIEADRVPEEQFDFDGFGWAFQVSQDSKKRFGIVIKAASAGGDSNNVEACYKWGVKRIASLIDASNFEEGKTYCYQWISASLGPREVKCQGFLWQRPG